MRPGAGRSRRTERRLRTAGEGRKASRRSWTQGPRGNRRPLPICIMKALYPGLLPEDAWFPHKIKGRGLKFMVVQVGRQGPRRPLSEIGSGAPHPAPHAQPTGRGTATAAHLQLQSALKAFEQPGRSHSGASSGKFVASTESLLHLSKSRYPWPPAAVLLCQKIGR